MRSTAPYNRMAEVQYGNSTAKSGGRQGFIPGSHPNIGEGLDSLIVATGASPWEIKDKLFKESRRDD
jgi:hypothetical protein